MATMELHVYSKALKRVTAVNVILPEIHKTKPGVGNPGGTYKTLYLLHGLSGDHTNWLRKTSIERYVNTYGIAVVMPNVGRSWYTDTACGEKYLTFVSEEFDAADEEDTRNHVKNFYQCVVHFFLPPDLFLRVLFLEHTKHAVCDHVTADDVDSRENDGEEAQNGSDFSADFDGCSRD